MLPINYMQKIYAYLDVIECYNLTQKSTSIQRKNQKNNKIVPQKN